MPPLKPETLPRPERPRLLHAFGWNTLGGILSAGSAFALGIILGRILGPRPFGLVAAAMLPISLGQLLIDQGMSAELIQKPALGAGDLWQARRRQVVVGGVLSATLALGSSALAHWYHIPELRQVVLALSPLFLLQALAQVPMALLKRHLRFQLLQAIQVGSYLFGYLIFGVPMAFSGFGAWSLVVAQTVQVLLQTAFLIFLSPQAHDHFAIEPTAQTQLEHAFAWRVMATNLANWSQTNLAGIIIGRNFGSLDLGLFNRAQNLVQTPLGILTASLQAVLFPSSAAAQNDIPRLRETFLKASRTLAWVAFPAAGLGISWSRPILEGIYGPAWAGAAPLMTPLLVALPFVALMSLTGPVLLGVGIASVELKIQVLLGLVTLIALIGIGRQGVFWMVWVIAVIQVVRWAWMTSALCPRIVITATVLFSNLGYPLLVGLLAGIGGWALDKTLQALDFGLFSRLATEAGCASICFIVALALRHHAKVRSMMAITSRLTGPGKHLTM